MTSNSHLFQSEYSSVNLIIIFIYRFWLKVILSISITNLKHLSGRVRYYTPGVLRTERVNQNFQRRAPEVEDFFFSKHTYCT